MSPPKGSAGSLKVPEQTPEQVAAAIAAYCAGHPQAAVLEDGKVVFDLMTAQHTVSTEHGRCTLHLWSEERNLVRRVVSATERGGGLRLATLRFGQSQTKLLELVADRRRRSSSQADIDRETARSRYVKTLERMLARSFPDWKPEGLRTAMDLEKSFGPAYARGSLTKGKQAWAVIGVNEGESAATVDGILTLGVLWLHHCRERAEGRRLYQGLKVIVPKGTAMLTLSRLAWMSTEAAQWELWELDESAEEMEQRDAADQGNVRTRLVHHPDEQAAAERFARAADAVMALVPAGEGHRVEQRLRSTAELSFLLHGMEFARARVGLAPNSFAQTLEITVGAGAYERPLTEGNRAMLAEHVGELFERRRAAEVGETFARKDVGRSRRIGAPMTASAHSRMQRRARTAVNDPLYRAAPERWLESVLRRDLAPLTRSLAPEAAHDMQGSTSSFANEVDPDTIGNRADVVDSVAGLDAGLSTAALRASGRDDSSEGGDSSRVIPRLDAQHVYAQVPAIAGASDRGMLDLLGVTADGRMAVIELKADDDLHFALQGLDYWIRVRHHHLQTADVRTGLGEFQRHGYFRGVELSPLPPRLYLVAPALHIHPATETVLRYLSPRVEWNLLALDERWRQQVRVVWRKQGGRAG